MTATDPGVPPFTDCVVMLGADAPSKRLRGQPRRGVARKRLLPARRSVDHRSRHSS